MKRYLAFLRGINISGKNKVPMAELKSGFESLDFADVKTYLNSGNVIFSSNHYDIDLMKDQIETMIKNRFQLDIPVFVFQKKIWSAFCVMLLTGGAMKIRRSMII